jgi:hypothetical protein
MLPDQWLFDLFSSFIKRSSIGSGSDLQTFEPRNWPSRQQARYNFAETF